MPTVASGSSDTVAMVEVGGNLLPTPVTVFSGVNSPVPGFGGAFDLSRTSTVAASVPAVVPDTSGT